METEKIIQELTERFAAPLPDFYQRRLIFWRDEDREFESDIDAIAQRLPVKTLRLTGSNGFAAKKQLIVDDPNGSYLIYDPVIYNQKEDDWLLNLRFYSEEFRSDLIEIWLDEMHLGKNPALRQTLKEYRKFFNSKERREKIVALKKEIPTPDYLKRAILAVLCGINSLVPKDMIRAVLDAGTAPDENEIYQKICGYGMSRCFWDYIAQTGYHAAEPTLFDFARHLIVTATAKTVPCDYLLGLEKFYANHPQPIATCYGLILDWLHLGGSARPTLFSLLEKVDDELKLTQRLAEMPIENLLQTECLPCVDEILLGHIFKGIMTDSFSADTLKKIVEQRRAMVWFPRVSCYYDAVFHFAGIWDFYQQHGTGFHIAEPEKIWRAYTDDYYQMDFHYRHFHLAFHESLSHSNAALDDGLKNLVEKVEGIYCQWFLQQLSDNWTNASKAQLAEHGAISGIARQDHFYADHIENAGKKIYVIIVDGLRYELATELAEALRKKKSEVQLESCQAIFPTSTEFGMAALLPHRQLTAVRNGKGELAILADGELTESPNRTAVLQKVNPNSVALQFETIRGMKRAERLDLVRGKEVIYLYLDTIDRIGHVAPDGVFQAGQQNIDEIMEAVSIIVNDFCAHYIYITADHGFLYTYHSLQEQEKVAKGISAEQCVKTDSRFLLTTKGAKPDYLLPVRFLDGKSNFDAFATRENVRIKKQGGYTKYVHGGIGLQEMVVPVISYHYVRNSLKGHRDNPERYDAAPVTLMLASSSRKITNLMFALEFFQKEPAGGNRMPATFSVYFADSEGHKISDTQRIIADKTSDNEPERTFRIIFNLNPTQYDRTRRYDLIISDEENHLLPQKEGFQIDIPLAMEGLDLFHE